MSAVDIQRTERDGIPVLWIPDDRTPRLTLAFRVGGLDESAAQTGISRFVQQLVLGAVRGDCALNGAARPLLTTFDAVGTPQELTAFLAQIGQLLTDLPTDRIADERRVLLLDDDSWTVADELVERRWGYTAAGRIVQPQRGHRTLDADELRDWARTRFTRAAAVLCWSGTAPPDELQIPLPDGPVTPLPPNLDAALVPLPLAATGEPGGLGISAIVPDDAAQVIACEVQRDRLQESLRGAYAADNDHVHMTWRDDFPDRAHVVWSTEIDGPSAGTAAAAAIGVLIRPWPDDEVHASIERAREKILDSFADRHVRHVVLIDEARRLLVGRPSSSLAQRRIELEAVDPAAVDIARRAIQATTYALVDPAVPHPGAPFHAEVTSPPDIESGTMTRRYESKGLRRSRRGRLTVSDLGVRLEIAGEPQGTLRWDELVTAIEQIDGRWNLEARNADWLELVPSQFKDPAAVRAALDAHVPAAVRLPAIGAQHIAPIAARAEADLTERQRARNDTEITLLPWVLEPDERVLKLASASRGVKAGLLVITDHRTLHPFLSFVSTDIAHDTVRGLRIEHPTSGVKLVLQLADGDDVRFDGGVRSAEFVALRDLLRDLIA